MKRNHQFSRSSRANANTRFIGKYIIFVEGRNTETSYLKLIKKSNCRVEPVAKPGSGIGSCIRFVQDVITKYNNLPKSERAKYREKWVVFDFDGHEDFAGAIRLARSNDFRVAFSSMCIEYWFLLHFIDHDGSPIPMKGDSHSQAQIDMLNKKIALYNKSAQVPVQLYESGSKCVEEDLYELMLAIDPVTHNRRIIDALNRAKSIHEYKKSVGAEFQESVTTIYELLISLGVFYQTNSGYALYCY